MSGMRAVMPSHEHEAPRRAAAQDPAPATEAAETLMGLALEYEAALRSDKPAADASEAFEFDPRFVVFAA